MSNLTIVIIFKPQSSQSKNKGHKGQTFKRQVFVIFV